MADVEVEPSPPGTLTAGTAQSQGATLSAQLSSSSTNNGRNFFPRALRNSPGLRPTDDGNGIQGVRMEVFSLRLPTPGTTMTRRIPELDTLLFRVGNPGRYQFLAFLTLSLTCLVIAPNNLAILFWGEEPTEYRCTDDTPAVENLLRWDNGTMTASYEEYLRWSVEDGRWNSSDVRQCTVEMRVPEAGYSERYYCRNWTFPGEEDATLVTDFHLVCRDRWRVNLATTIYFLGLLVGALLFGFLADHYGRRVVILISGSAAVIFGVGTSFSRNYAAFIVLRFLLGILLQGMQIAFILTVEWLPVVKRSFFGTLSQLIWSVGVMFLAFLGYLFPNWNDLQLAMSLVGLLLVMTYFL
ncbi:putative Solute carrier family 22 member 3 [Hypsibius exemplaris]|uniref:Solute carrier family 22 member 3 n=1 Tax=Hypsibius exemplaris TaxID=2072580 RepID=A0A1W0X4G7_HYPEX|nr:putative Solute carrier family 22 member 3 [Hypsibius exemplaris]